MWFRIARFPEVGFKVIIVKKILGVKISVLIQKTAPPLSNKHWEFKQGFFYTPPLGDIKFYPRLYVHQFLAKLSWFVNFGLIWYYGYMYKKVNHGKNQCDLHRIIFSAFQLVTVMFLVHLMHHVTVTLDSVDVEKISVEENVTYAR